jgi:hypothetical protein
MLFQHTILRIYNRLDPFLIVPEKFWGYFESFESERTVIFKPC